MEYNFVYTNWCLIPLLIRALTAMNFALLILECTHSLGGLLVYHSFEVYSTVLDSNYVWNSMNVFVSVFSRFEL